MLRASVDEFTLVLQAPRDQKLELEDAEDWDSLANRLIIEFENKAKFVSILGSKMQAEKCPAGYVQGFCYGRHNFYVVVAYNKTAYNMGIVIKFSAEALHYYLAKSKQEIYDFLQNVESDMYSMRLSRIDFDIDFIDEVFTVNSLYEKIKSKKVEVFLQKQQKEKVIFSKRNLRYRGFMDEGKIQTIYLNSPLSSVNCRIYNKRLEEIKLRKPEMKFALSHSWIRFEAVFKNEYAHTYFRNKDDEKKEIYQAAKNTGDSTLMEIFKVGKDTGNSASTQKEETQKFFFKNADGTTSVYTKKMLDALKSNDFQLLGQMPQDNDLNKLFEYVLENSGTISTLYKIKTLWGVDALAYAVSYINHYVSDWDANQNCIEWLKKHANDTKETYPNFSDFIAEFE